MCGHRMLISGGVVYDIVVENYYIIKVIIRDLLIIDFWHSQPPFFVWKFGFVTFNISRVISRILVIGQCCQYNNPLVVSDHCCTLELIK